jgi:hypothetical protein
MAPMNQGHPRSPSPVSALMSCQPGAPACACRPAGCGLERCHVRSFTSTLTARRPADSCATAQPPPVPLPLRWLSCPGTVNIRIRTPHACAHTCTHAHSHTCACAHTDSHCAPAHACTHQSILLVLRILHIDAHDSCMAHPSLIFTPFHTMPSHGRPGLSIPCRAPA